jgi:MscS family membrane protein
MIWDDVVLGALPKPTSIIIWISSFSYVADIIQRATQNMLFYELFDPAREIGIIVCLVVFAIGLINKAEQNILIHSEVSDQTTIHALAKLGYLVVSIAGGLTLLQTLGLSISGLMAFGGMGGIAVGFAAQDLLSNFSAASFTEDSASISLIVFTMYALTGSILTTLRKSFKALYI